MSPPLKRMTHAQLRPRFKDGMTLMFGGFLSVGTPKGIVREILESGARDLTIIGNDTATPDSGIGILIAAKRVKKVIASHIGTNPETGRQMIAGELDVELVPQGTLAERIRCGGAGLAILKAHLADEKGNLVYRRAARNFNPLMAMAADYVVAEVDQIVEPGAIDPDLVMTPGVLINALILAGEQ